MMAIPNFYDDRCSTKAATTSFFHYFDQYPQIFMFEIKATNYCGYEDACDRKWANESDRPLLQNFPVRIFEVYEVLFSEAFDEISIGEVSRQYFCYPTASWRIHECIPNVNLAVSLRNPADRAFSGFMIRTRRGENEVRLSREPNSSSSNIIYLSIM